MTVAVLPDETVTPTEPSASSTAAVVRTSFYWQSRGESLFAWLHAPRDVPCRDHAVLIAAPIGYEQLHANRSLRHLADELARRGIPVLRFDWHGTGNSVGVDDDPDRWSTWRNNLRDAAKLLTQRFGIPHVSVIGLRIGATLAATTFQSGEIENLVLWAPVTSGKTYVREMTAIDRTAEYVVPPAPGSPQDIEPAGFVLTEATAKELAELNLLKLTPVSARTLIVSREDAVNDQKLLDAYHTAGIAAEQMTCAGYAEMMADPHRGSVPWPMLSSITEWLSAHIAADEFTETPRIIQESLSREITFHDQSEGSSSSATTSTIRERLLQISDAPSLFGIVSEPVTPPSDERPMIVLATAGAAYHIGPGRLYVHLARRLATAGFRCLRFDIAGIGDSPADSPDVENCVYTATAFRDLDVTLQSLRQQGLGRTFVLMGLCSGAYNSFQSAASLSDPALIESILINPLTFFWKDGMVVEELADRQIAVRQHYWESAWNPTKWLRLLSGRSRIGLCGAVRVLVEHVRHRLELARAANGGPKASHRPQYSHPVRDDLTSDLHHVVEHQRRLAMFFAESDPGYDILIHKAGKYVRQLQQSGQLHVEFIEDADHNFSRRSCRRELLDRVTAHLTRRYH